MNNEDFVVVRQNDTAERLPPSYLLAKQVKELERDALRARVQELERLLRRYRNETPLGHQPHMIAHEVDAALQEGK